ncbi:hypothetical protein KR222_009565 [Zaprionus bogoriensis]|nr:hypothetical protein KR222_009565 [Zaprionus bogoriensis]
MSERSKGDVSSSSSSLSSRVNNNTANRIVKNPLLSASVTGLSFDDFPNKPLLLPAAPPVVHAPPPQLTNALIAGILNREPKSLVTVGQASSIDDSETLDEINLNASSSDDSTAAGAFGASSQNAADANANPLLEPPPSSDSLLSQAASSFGALPSVASNVFSTFSKRIYGDAADEQQQQQQQQPQLEIQPNYIQQAAAQIPQAAAAPAPFYAAPPAGVGEAAPEPPKFYAPTELPTLGANAAALPPPSAGQNTYRISAKKKLYAPIPGLSEQQQAPQQPFLPTTAPFQTPPYPVQAPAPAPVPASAPTSEERKSGGGLFSLTSLVPQGVLQNISGLVSSATGRGSNDPAPSASTSYGAPHPGYFDITSGASSAALPQPPTNYFTTGAVPVAAPAPTGYFVPTEAPPTVGGFFNPTEVAAPPASVGGFFNPTEVSQPPTSVGGFFTPAEVTGVYQQPTVAPPPTATAPPAAAPPPVIAPPAAAAPQPAAAPPTTFAPPPTAFTPQAVAAPPAVAPPAAVVAPTAFAPSSPAFAPPPTAFAPAAAAPPAVLPSAGESNVAFGAPPPAAAPPTAAVPPPAAGQTSYRLQKGTRLYKSPLTAQETAATTALFEQQIAGVAASAAPAAIFNPFGSVANTSFAPTAPSVTPTPTPPPPAALPAAPQAQQVAATSATFFTPVQEVQLFPSSAVEPPFAPPKQDLQQEIPLFAAPAPPTEGITLFPAAATQLFTPVQTELAAPQAETAPQQEVPLFAAPPTAAQEVVSTAAPAQEHSAATAALFAPDLSEETSQQTPLFAAPPTTQSVASTAEQILANSAPTLSVFAPVQPETSSPLEPSQQVPLFAAVPPTAQEVTLFTPSSSAEQPQAHTAATATLFVADQNEQVPLFAAPPAAAQESAPTEQPAPTASLFPVDQNEAPSDLQPSQPIPAVAATTTVQDIPLFPPAATDAPQDIKLYPSAAATALQAASEAPQEAQLYPPAKAVASAAPIESQQETPLFVPVPTAAVALYPPAAAASAAAPAPEQITSSETATACSLFGAPLQPTAAASVALSTQTTTTFFNPFAQTITTPLPQDLLAPPIGFANPFRRNSAATAFSEAPAALLSFFTPAAGSGSSSDFNFFGQPQEQAAAPPAPPAAAAPATGVLGFEQLISDRRQTTGQNVHANQVDYQNSSVNSFSGYFNGPAEAAAPAAQQQQQQQQQEQQQQQQQEQPSQQTPQLNFFDNFSSGAQGAGQEDQRIQNFFNNPPLQDQPAAPGELKYDLVHSGLRAKQFEERSQTSVSNLVEPPSSACSEFSTAAAIVPALAATPATAAATAAADALQADQLEQLYQGELPEELLRELRMASEKGLAVAPSSDAMVYTPALVHWFYKRNVDGRFQWLPFSHYDSALLETSLMNEIDATSNVPVEGGRYDVNIKERTKSPVYWEGKASEVRRCSWFYKGVDSKYVPYPESTAEALEEEYKRATETGEWQKKIALGNGEQVTMHGPNVIVHFMPPSSADTWGGTVQSSSRPLVVRRDLNDFKIQQGESQRVDHLLFMVHGIGSACDLKMRNVEEVVDDFRNIAQQLVQSHYKNSTDMGLVGRVEVLPIEWHGHLHSEELGIDEKLKSITLESIPRLRNFTNDTLLDVLFYTSPKYCQKIMNTVADALNEVYLKYRMRHPEFNGGVSLAGHSLGSLILFDLLCHQEPLKESEEENKENPDQLPQNCDSASKQVQLTNNDQMLPKQVSYAMGMGPAGTGQPVINYTQLIFHPKKFFALGSPIGMFVTIRGIDKLGLDFRLPTCPGFYNIFHPFDPVAYRIEALVNPDMKGIRPVLIPHHKGRKRMHLELKETMTRVGADIKQRFMDTFKNTLDSVSFLSTVAKVKREAEESVEKETNSQVFQKQSDEPEETSLATTSTHARNRTDSESTTASDPEFIELDFPLGKLNDSKRVDYVLQEAPLEFINEYIFALSSHVCYWGSEDTILFVMKEIYAGLGISTDSQVPQQSMTIERPASRTNSIGQSLLPM